MATQIGHGFTSSAIDGQLHKRVADSAEALLHSIGKIERLAGRRQFVLVSCQLLRFTRMTADGHSHKVCVHGDKPVVETHIWQIHGRIQGRIINAISEYRFYTHEDNLSGHGESLLNGKDHSLKPEYGGVTLDDLWQDVNLWQGAREAALEGAS